MAYSLRKVLSSLTATLLAISGIASAFDGGHTYESYGNPCSPCAPVCNPCGNDCGDFFVDVDVLYWKACEGGLTYGSETEFNELITATTFATYETKKKNPHFRWDVGVRVGLGYHFACECYDAAIYWTHFDTDAHGHHDEFVDGGHWFTPSWGGVTPLLGGTSEGTFGVERASAHWKLRLNLIDLEIGREFCVNSCLSLRPFIGVRGAIIDQRYDLEYIAVDESETLPSPIDRFRLKSNFEGAGIRCGLDTAYNLGCGVSLYGDLAGSLLWGESEVKTQEEYEATPAPTSSFTEMHQKDRDCGSRAITDAAIGLRWQQCCCNKVITLEVGWEHHFFFNNNNFEKFTNFGSTENAATDRFPQDIHGDLSVQGFVFSAKLEF